MPLRCSRRPPWARPSWQGLPFMQMMVLLTVLNTMLFCWNHHPYAGPHHPTTSMHELVVHDGELPTGQAWNGTFHFLRPRWKTLMEFLEVCGDFDGSERSKNSSAAWIGAMQPLFAPSGPSFTAAAAALNDYQQAVSAPGKRDQQQGPYTCTPWVSTQDPAPRPGRAAAAAAAAAATAAAVVAAPRIAMVTLSTTNLLDKAAVAIALKDKQEYCDQHGYDFHTITETVPGRDAAWAKLPGILSLLHRYDWIVSLDLDTVIYDHSIRLEEFLDPNHDMIIGLDYNGINSGVFFLRNSTWSRALLTEAWTITNEPMSHVWWEQSALMRLVKSEGVRNHVKYCPQMYFNSYIAADQSVNMQENNDRGPFIVHFAGVGTKWEILPRFHAQRQNVKQNVGDGPVASPQDETQS